jgi:hypothetical protein
MINNYTYRKEHIYVWQNGEALWLNAISHADAPLRVYNSLTEYYITRAAYARNADRQYWFNKGKANNQKIFNMPIRQNDQGLLAITYYNEGLMTDDLFEQLQLFKQALEILPTYSAAMQGIALCYFRLAELETDASTKNLYAQKSLEYFRKFLDNPGTLSDQRDKQLEVIDQLKTKFPSLEIQQL